MIAVKIVIIWLVWSSVNYACIKHAFDLMHSNINARYPGGKLLYWSNSDRALCIIMSAICPLGSVFAIVANADEYLSGDGWGEKPVKW